MLKHLVYTFINKDTDLPFVNFLVEVYAIKSSSPLRIYGDIEGRNLISKTGQTYTDSNGTISVYVPDSPQYELVLSNRLNRIVLDRVSTSGNSSTIDTSSLNQFSEAETESIRAFIEGSTPGSGTVTSVNASGGTTGLSFSGGPVIGSGTLTVAGTLARANGGTGATTATAAFTALAPTTTKGDLVASNGTLNVRVPVGTNGQVLTADSSAASGVSYQTPATAVSDGDKGDIVISGSGTVYSIDTGVITAAARTVLDDASVSAMRTTLGVQPLDATLTAWAALAVAANKGMYATGVDAFATYDLTVGGRAIGGVDGSGADTFPYFSAANVVSVASLTSAGRALIDDTTASAQRTTLGLAIGSNVQAYSAALDQLSTLADSGIAGQHLQSAGPGSPVVWATPIALSAANVWTGVNAYTKTTADQSFSKQIPITGFTITIGAGVKTLILEPAGTLAAGTVTMPAAPINGQEVRICSTKTITTLTVSANSGQTLANAFATTLTAGTGIGYLYVLADTQWVRLY